ncbi:hypothetical protein Hanom_Chr10g00940681 [Helianthus anomalus]
MKGFCCITSSTFGYGFLQTFKYTHSTKSSVINAGSTCHFCYKQLNPFCTVSRRVFQRNIFAGSNQAYTFIQRKNLVY